MVRIECDICGTAVMEGEQFQVLLVASGANEVRTGHVMDVDPSTLENNSVDEDGEPTGIHLQFEICGRCAPHYTGGAIRELLLKLPEHEGV